MATRDSRYYAYFNKVSNEGPRWFLIDSEIEKAKFQKIKSNKFIVTTPVPDVTIAKGQTIYVGTGFWYTADVVIDIEPVFNKNTFDRFVYYLKENGVVSRIEFELTPKLAIIQNWKNKFVFVGWRISTLFSKYFH